ncbi:hypothetical protein NPIL_101591 [Nephila pilipes]|uniref:Uncharacterized protein n=1 Tax=Nephila pilipes TaxID=299642 RepID=A0A8X6U7R4_NEPPI|nr:hypothetical protein NPIL_101591 [Nephila pilipes]
MALAVESKWSRSETETGKQEKSDKSSITRQTLLMLPYLKAKISGNPPGEEGEWRDNNALCKSNDDGLRGDFSSRSNLFLEGGRKSSEASFNVLLMGMETSKAQCFRFRF